MTDGAPLVEAAGGLVSDGRGRLAIVYRPHRGDWSLPKGKLDPGETHEQAALREVHEETGLLCTVDGTAGETRYVDRRGRPKRVAYFSMSVVGGTFTPNDEVSEISWIGPDDVGRLSYECDVLLAREHWPR